MSQSFHASCAEHYKTTKTDSTARGVDAEKLSGRFGRLFEPENGHVLVKPHVVDKAALSALGRKGGAMDEGISVDPAADSEIPAGYTFLGQFVDHDITLDPESSLNNMDQKAEQFENFRTPNLDLDCVYGAGPDATPFLYDSTKRLQIGEIIPGSNQQHDLPRFRGRALIGDPRNDENLLVSQLQLGFLKFHNALMDVCNDDFNEARRSAIYYYHTMLREDFLPRIIGQDLTDEISRQRLFYFPLGFVDAPRRPYMPIEFSVAAYRYGHSQVRAQYTMNREFENVSLFDKGIGLKGFEPARTWVDWSYLFETSHDHHSFSRKIDTKLPESLMDLKVARVVDSEPVSLAERNLHRGLSFNLWTGQSVAQQLQNAGASDVNILAPDTATTEAGMTESPLWYYILQDADQNADGQRLGPVGGRLVGEVLLGLIEHYWVSVDQAQWQPQVSVPQQQADRFQITDILRFAGVLD